MKPFDGPRILEIYKMGIESKKATFEISIPTWEEWDARHHAHSRFVFQEENRVVGWAALTPVSSRKAYEGVAEISLYIDPGYWGKGIGKLLMKQVIASSEENGIWTLLSVIFPENLASIKLQKALGFRFIGRRERIARLDGVWKDTLMYERRSSRIGS